MLLNWTTGVVRRTYQHSSVRLLAMFVRCSWSTHHGGTPTRHTGSIEQSSKHTHRLCPPTLEHCVALLLVVVRRYDRCESLVHVRTQNALLATPPWCPSSSYDQTKNLCGSCTRSSPASTSDSSFCGPLCPRALFGTPSAPSSSGRTGAPN